MGGVSTLGGWPNHPVVGAREAGCSRSSLILEIEWDSHADAPTEGRTDTPVACRNCKLEKKILQIIRRQSHFESQTQFVGEF